MTGFFLSAITLGLLKIFCGFIMLQKVDAIFADLGVSSHDFDVAERGFSFRFDDKLDMRMNRNSAVDAAGVIKQLQRRALVFIIKMYGEIKNARRLVVRNH
jgi:16S rRNA (cytosine1402-N4)-methyltransferase